MARIGDAPKPPPSTSRSTSAETPAKPAAPSTAAAAPAAGWNPSTVQVNGAPRRETMRMDNSPASLEAQSQMPIACPVLKALVADGSMHVDPNGKVKTSEMLDALRARGLTEPMLETLRTISYFANRPQDIPRNALTQSFDVMHLRSGLTMHDADSNILSRGQFDQAAFDRFTSHAKGGYMDASAFAAAVADQTIGDMHAQNPLVAVTFGQNAVLAEYPVLLQLFNTKDPSGKPAISVEALKDFWKDGKLPARAASPDSISMVSSAKAYAVMLSRVEPKLAGDVMRSVATATGLALEGVRLSTADVPPSPAATAGTMAGLGAGKAAKCPHLSGGAAMKTPLAANLDAHVK